MSKTLKNIFVYLVAFTMVFTTAFMFTLTDSHAAVPKPKAIYVTATSRTVDIGGVVRATVYKTSPANANRAVKWKSSNKRIATVNSAGYITGKKVGTVKITATSTKNKRAKRTIKIYVRKLVPTSVNLNKTEMSLYLDDGKGTISASLGPVGVRNIGIGWTSSDAQYATVTPKGNTTTVTPLIPGDVTVTARSLERTGVTKACTVHVKDIVFTDPIKRHYEKLYPKEPSYTNAAKIVPGDFTGAEYIRYESSNPKVATVNATTGEVTKLKAGTTTITAYSLENEKATASYEFKVGNSQLFPTAEGSNLVYQFDSNRYSAYKIKGVRPTNGDDIELVVDEDAVKSAFGEKEGGLNVWSGSSVQTGFVSSSLDFSSGGYEVYKENGSPEVRIKYVDASGNQMPTSYWYYRDDEVANSMDGFDPDNNGTYHFVLYSAKEGPVTGANTLTVDLTEGKNIDIHAHDTTFRVVKDPANTVTVSITEESNPTLTVIFEKTGTTGVYNLKIPSEDVGKYEFIVFPWQLK